MPIMYSPKGVMVRANDEGVREIFFKSNKVGEVRKVEANGLYQAHWAGEVVNLKNEYWSVSEETIADVRVRVYEAFK